MTIDDNLRHKLQSYSLEELELMLDRGMFPEYLQEDRTALIAAVIEVIKEKKKDLTIYTIF